jgi:hypothetical protein
VIVFKAVLGKFPLDVVVFGDVVIVVVNVVCSAALFDVHHDVLWFNAVGRGSSALTGVRYLVLYQTG